MTQISEEAVERLKELFEKYGESVIKEAQTRLKNQRKIATGNLYRSLSYEVEEAANDINLIFYAEDYMEYVDKGRRPGGKMPPIAPLKKWARKKGIPQRAVYPIARSIATKGIRPTNFWTISITRRDAWLERQIEKITQEGLQDAVDQIAEKVRNDYN